MNPSKTELRAHFKNVRNNLNSRDVCSRLICQNLKDLLYSLGQGLWAFYKPHNNEVDLSALPQTLEGYKFAYPKVNDQILEFYIPNTTESFVKGAFGIVEPEIENSKKVSLNEFSGFVVPGVSFDKKGNRIGSGLGYYDKYLKNFQGTRIGVCFSTQIYPFELPNETFDIKYDFVVTETEILEIKH